jgi:hypothetical protein
MVSCEYQSQQPSEIHAAERALSDIITRCAQLDPLKSSFSVSGLTTTTETPTVLMSVSVPSGKVTSLIAEVFGFYANDELLSYSSVHVLTVRRQNDQTTIIGSQTTLHAEDDSASVSLVADGPNVNVVVEGTAYFTINWSARLTMRSH